MNVNDSLTQVHIAAMRWTILRTIGVGLHLGVTETMCLDVCRSEYIGVTPDRVRAELDYLKKRELVCLQKSEAHPWRVTLSRHGRDFVDYEIDPEPGITRPPRPTPHAD